MNSIKQIEVLLADRLVGRLALTKEGLCAFEYAPDWLGSGFSISPFELPLRSGVFIAKPRPFEGGFGVFDDCLPDGWGQFQDRGGSPGGARPKIFARYEGKEWLVKFRAKRDPQSIGVDEYRYSLLAKECGIEMPETRLFEDKYFGVERFDRTPQGKLHVVSVAGLIGADYRLPSIDYKHIFQVCAVLTHSVAELWKVYRLMAFNYLIGNKDDHAKNFAFIHRDGDWHFAPAYDLLPSDGINGFRTTSINDSIEPMKEDLLAVAAKAGLNEKEADTMFDRVQERVGDKR